MKEAVVAVTSVLPSRRFTTRFPAEPCVVPEKYRGKPEFDLDTCIGCGACVNACPSQVCLTQTEDLDRATPVRTITLNYYTCIFCGNCEANCTTGESIKLSKEWDLATLDKESQVEPHEFELQMCEKCGAKIGTRKHLKSGQLLTKPQDIEEQPGDKEVETSDFMRILCPTCKCELNIRL
ncbi:MAG: 4Fe-4S dicluster domain-containing protein [Planctomycetota bacterium]